MKLVALLSWYNESPHWLSTCVASLSKIGVDHVVALDGAYALFPNGRARSDLAEVEAIHMAADAISIGCTIEQPRTVWYGNEQEKRTRLFELGASLCTPGEDWFFVLDADEVVNTGSERVRDQLEATTAHAAQANLEQWWGDVQADSKKAEIARMFEHPSIFGHLQTRFFRVLHNMRCDTTHYTYVGEWEGVEYALRSDKAGERLGYTKPETISVSDRVSVLHRDPMRDASRKKLKHEYYERRDAAGIERV